MRFVFQSRLQVPVMLLCFLRLLLTQSCADLANEAFAGSGCCSWPTACIFATGWELHTETVSSWWKHVIDLLAIGRLRVLVRVFAARFRSAACALRQCSEQRLQALLRHMSRVAWELATRRYRSGAHQLAPRPPFAPVSAVKPENILLVPLSMSTQAATGQQGLAATSNARDAIQSHAAGLCKGGATAAIAANGLRDYIVRLCDFGCALIAAEGADLATVRGSSGKGSTMYCAPEVYMSFVAARDKVSP